jgi:hypothetical protein
MLKFHNIHELILAIYIFLDISVTSFLVIMASTFKTTILNTYVLLDIIYIVISWLTFKRKTLRDAYAKGD